MCLSNEGLSHQESSEMVRQVRLGRALGEAYIAAQGASQKVAGLIHQALESPNGKATTLAWKVYEWRASGFNRVMAKYHLKVRA